MANSFVIADRYKISSTIGSGGNSYVYLAFDTIRNTNVAIKSLKCTIDDLENENYKKYLQEIAIMANMNSKNIVKIFDYGIFENHPYVVMEYVRGYTLRQYIHQQGYLLPSEVYTYTLQMLESLEACHLAGIIHRDIKNENFVVQPDGTLIMLDFGTAKILDEEKNIYIDERAIGTIEYMSPELILNNDATVQSDIYAVGISMFEMCTGILPFTDPKRNTKELYLKHSKSELPDVNKYNPKIPESFIKIIKKACAKSVDERYRSTFEMHEDLISAYKEFLSPSKKKKQGFFARLFKKGDK